MLKESEPLVSVIIPVYNAQKTIERCLNSVLCQSYAALEVLAVNDGSADQSLALLREFETRDSRVRVLTQENSGVAAARNLALISANGTYVQFVDSDDELPPDSIKMLVTAMRTRDCDIAIAPYTEVVGTIRQRRGYLKSDQVLSQRMFLDRLSEHPNSFYYAVLWNKLYRRDWIIQNDIRFDGRLPWGEDFAFNTCYYRYVQSAAVLSNPVYDYIRNPGGLALSTARQCLIHPIYSIRVKIWLQRYYNRLFKETGLYEQYRHVLPKYLFRVTLSD